MASTAGSAAPTAERIEALDFVRGCALFGILLMNIVGMGLGPAYDDPTIAGGATGINLWSWIVTSIAFEGTQRALFSMLFGAGVILFTARLEAAGRTDVADIYLRRNMLLIGFGIVNAFILLFVGDILFYYGVTALFLFVFRKLPGRTLLAIGLGALVLNAAWNALDTYNLSTLHQEYRTASAVAPSARTPAQKHAIEKWKAKESDAKPPPEAFAAIKRGYAQGYWSAMQTTSAVAVRFESWGLYRNFFDFFGMMLLGMGLYKLGVLTLQVRTRIYLAMLALGYAVGLTVNIAETRWIIDNGFSFLAYKQAAISYDLGRLAMTMGHLGALMLFLKSGALSWLRRSMAAVGRMAFTNYITHSVVALTLFTGFGLFGTLERHQLYLIVFAVWAMQLVISPVWLRHFRFGPLEWLWRYLTYGERPPFRRASPAPAALAPAE
jgi:uncharacterized protein